MIEIPFLLAMLIVGLPPVSEERLPELVREHQGQVLVLNFWATWCGPCREEFPYFVELYRERKKDGLTVLTISLDEPEDAGRAEAFLADQGAEFPSYIRGFKDFEAFVNSIDPQWSGALPATFVYDRNGKLQFRRIGEITKAELQSAVEPLLKR